MLRLNKPCLMKCAKVYLKDDQVLKSMGIDRYNHLGLSVSNVHDLPDQNTAIE